MGQFALYLALNARCYIGQLDLLLLINYKAIPENQIETILKPIHQSIARKLLKVLIRPACPNKGSNAQSRSS